MGLKIKDGAYIVNLDVYESIGTYLLAWYANDKNLRYFDTFGVETIPNKN